MERPLGTLSFLTVAALLLAAGCEKKGEEGGSAKPAPSAPEPSASAPAPAPATGGDMMGKPVVACSLLTKAEAEAATGEKLGEPEGKGSSCSFLDDTLVRVVLVEVSSLKDPSTAKQLFDVTSADKEVASGFGDAAYWAELMGAERLNILKGPYTVMVQVGLIRSTGPAKEPARKAAAAIAAKVLGKLP
jgi:hypothetical protein